MDFRKSEENTKKNLETLITKCWEDEAFKNKLISNPKEAIESISKKPLDLNEKEIVVTDQSDPSSVFINIPPNPNNMELSETDLEAVAGGKGIVILWSGLCVEW